jgi:hypothetical protein
VRDEIDGRNLRPDPQPQQLLERRCVVAPPKFERIPKLGDRRWAVSEGGRIFGVVSDTGESQRRTAALRRRRWVILGAGVVLAAIAAVVLALFQPWKLWIDDKVDQAAPVGAVPITTLAESIESSPTPAAPATPTSPATDPAVTDPPATTALPTTTVPETTPATVASTTLPPIPVGGAFSSIDHGTSGTVVLLQDETGTRFVRLENLDTSNGPDLYVYMSSNPPDGPEGQFDDDFVNLGRLEGNVGSSNYVIPPGTDISRYASVVIWCDRFDSAFGAAQLS